MNSNKEKHRLLTLKGPEIIDGNGSSRTFEALRQNGAKRCQY